MAIHQMDPTQNCIEGCGRFLTNTRKKLLPMLKGGGLGIWYINTETLVLLVPPGEHSVFAQK